MLIDLEGHGREDILPGVDLSRTVGWFTTIFPALLELGEASGPGEDLKSIKERLRGIPQRGIGYGLLRYMSGDPGIAEKLRALPQAEICFNYLGQFDQVLPADASFAPARESSGPAQRGLEIPLHKIEINGLVAGGRLRMDWRYSENVHRRATIERLAKGFIEALRLLIQHCLSPGAGGHTPSDFREARLSQEELDDLLAELAESEE